MQILASKFIYPSDQENLTEVLSPFRNMGIQLSFFQKGDFLRMNHASIKEVCNFLGIEISTVHAPTVDVFNHDFLKIMGEIKSVYNVNLITIHPQKGENISAISKLEEYAKAIEDLNITLAYENFPSSVGKRKWIYLPKEMFLKFDLSFLRLTFDTSHLDSPKDCVEEFDVVADKVAIVHLSDSLGRDQHQPLGTGCVPYKQFMRYLKDIDFQGPVVIEYMPEYKDRLIEDVGRLLAV